MFKVKFTTTPDGYDEYQQPYFIVHQTKGLLGNQNNDLLTGSKNDGYTKAVADKLYLWIYQQVEDFSNGRKKLDVLEIGGGQGHYFEWVKDFVNTYINIEPSRIFLDSRAQARVKNPMYLGLKCSAENIPLGDESVDVILSNASLDHIPDYHLALSECSRLLRHKGLFIFTLNNRRSWWKVLLSRTAFLKRREEVIFREHYFQWSYAQCRSELSKYLNINYMTTVTFMPFVPKIWRLLLPLVDLLGQHCLSHYGSNILVVCQKKRSSRTL